ncbi:hypothetical protein [Sporosarcina luteola]
MGDWTAFEEKKEDQFVWQQLRHAAR